MSKNTQNTLLTLAAIGIVGYVGYSFYTKNRNSANQQPDNNNGDNGDNGDNDNNGDNGNDDDFLLPGPEITDPEIIRPPVASQPEQDKVSDGNQEPSPPNMQQPDEHTAILQPNWPKKINYYNNSYQTIIL